MIPESDNDGSIKAWVLNDLWVAKCRHGHVSIIDAVPTYVLGIPNVEPKDAVCVECLFALVYSGKRHDTREWFSR